MKFGKQSNACVLSEYYPGCSTQLSGIKPFFSLIFNKLSIEFDCSILGIFVFLCSSPYIYKTSKIISQSSSIFIVHSLHKEEGLNFLARDASYSGHKKKSEIFRIVIHKGVSAHKT